MNNLGILIIDMQPFFIKRDLFKQKNLIKKQLELIEFARNKNIPLFVLEYNLCEETVKQLKDPLVDANAQFIDKYNDNAFIIVKNPTKNKEQMYIYNLNPIILNRYFTDVNFCYEEHVKESKLDKTLKENSIQDLILTGIHKDSCVLETAKEAKKRGYNVITTKDIIDKRNDSISWWYEENIKYLNSLNELFNFIETPRFINN